MKVFYASQKIELGLHIQARIQPFRKEGAEKKNAFKIGHDLPF